MESIVPQKTEAGPVAGCNRRHFISSVAGGLTLGFFLPDGINRLDAAGVAERRAELPWGKPRAVCDQREPK